MSRGEWKRKYILKGYRLFKRKEKGIPGYYIFTTEHAIIKYSFVCLCMLVFASLFFATRAYIPLASG